MISSIDCPALYKLWGGEIYLGSNCIDFTSVIIMIVLMQGSCHHQSILAPSAAQVPEPELSLHNVWSKYNPGSLIFYILSFYSLTRPEMFLRKVQTAEHTVIMDVRVVRTSAFYSVNFISLPTNCKRNRFWENRKVWKWRSLSPSPWSD